MAMSVTRKIGVEAKRGMRTRVLTGGVLIGFAFVILLFSALSSTERFGWFDFTNEERTGFFAGFVMLISILLIMAGFETSRLVFKKNTMALGVVVFCMVTITVAPIIPLALNTYGMVEMRSPYLVMFGTLMLAIILSAGAMVALLSAFGLMSLRNVSTLLFLAIWIGAFFFCLCYLSVSKGWPVLLLAVLIPLFADSFAYFGGTLFGVHKMAPSVSPKKTWEGAIIALFGTTGVMCLVLYGYMQDSSHMMFTALFSADLSAAQVWPIIVFGTMFLTAFSIAGDLLFSYVKRRYAIKDFSAVFPGHGGVLDRADSLSFVTVCYSLTIFIIAAVSTYYAAA